jgi:hypothetical protein
MLLGHKEINLLNGTHAAAGNASECALVTPASYSGTVNYCLEVYVSAYTSATTASLRLSGSSTPLTGSSISITGVGLYRSGPISGVGNSYYAVGLSASGATIKAARIIVSQDTGTSPLTGTEAQFEIGNRETGKVNTTTHAALTAPKYWEYEADKWDGSLTCQAELVWNTVSTNTVNAVLQESTNGGSSWATKVTIVNNATGTTIQRTRATFTPTDGALYRIASFGSSSMNAYAIYAAKIVVVQTGIATTTYRFDGSQGITDSAGGWSNDANAFDGNTGTSASLVTASTLKGVGTTAPATNTYQITRVRFRANVNVASGSNMYAFVSNNSATVSATDDIPGAASGWRGYTTIAAPASGWSWNDLANLYILFGMNSGTSASVAEAELEVTYIQTEIAKTQEHYLLANTGLATGTAAQKFLSDWDPAEWDGVENTYRHAIASGGTGSTVELETEAGVQIIGSSIASAAPQVISSSLTMPAAAANLDVQATTNGGNVYASRIIVNIVKYTAPPPTGSGVAYTFCMIV